MGGGEHARVVLEAALSQPQAWEVRGYVARAPTTMPEVRWLGTDEELLSRDDWRDARFVLGVGWSAPVAAREALAHRFDERGVLWAVLFHAWARVSPDVSLGAGAVVMAGAVVNGGATLGAHCVVNTGAVVEHDVRLGRHVHVAPGTVIGGGTVVGDRAFLGLGCRIRDHIRVGADARVGMGATVVAPVGDGLTVIGTPARPVTMGASDA